MPLPLEVLTWVAVACLTLLTALGIAFMAALILAALEARKAIRALAREVRWWRERRQQLWYRARFAQKWVKHFSRNLIG